MGTVLVLVALPAARADAAGTPIAPADLGLLRVFRSVDGTTFAQVGEVVGPFEAQTVEYRDEDVEPGPYAYRVRVVDVDGRESGDSDAVPCVVPVPVAAPGAPVIVSVTAV